MDVAAWLQDLGLECYVPVFPENEVDERVLPSLTAGRISASPRSGIAGGCSTRSLRSAPRRPPQPMHRHPPLPNAGSSH